jgi:bla regulator protein blaR1
MRHIGLALVLGAVVIAVTVMASVSQTPAQKPKFDVASIKPTDPAQRGISIQNTVGGRLVTRGVPLRLLMTYAYNLRDFQISGGPDWIATDRWDIEARAEEGGVTPPTGRTDPNAGDRMAIRLQSLLEDRFQLKIHREMKELPIYELAIAKSGLKMKSSSDQTPFQLPAPGTPQPPPQRGAGVPRYNLRIGRGSIEASAVEMAPFVQTLSQQVGRIIVEKTGLKGLYDIKLVWAPDPISSARLNGPEAAPPIDSNGPSIFTAIEEQLGLKLESARGPVEVLVIDSVQKPSEN